MKFRILYVILLLANLVFGSIYIVGPIIIRYLANIVLLIVCIREKVPYPKSMYVNIYTVFIFIFMLTSFWGGYEVDFFKLFVGYYLTTYLWIWATYILFKKYNSVCTMVYTLFAICIVNAVVTIGQHFMIPISFAIPQYLGVSTAALDSMVEKSDMVITQFALFGIFGGFQNGYYSAVGAVLSMVLWARKRNIIYLIFFPISVYGLFCVQERAGFVAGLFFSFVFLYKTLIDSKSIIIKGSIVMLSILLIIYFASYGLNYSSYLAGTRYESFDFDTRVSLYKWSNEYIVSHPFDANLFDFFYKYQHYPHNFIYNSFIYGTIIGGLMIIGCMIAIWIKSFKIMLHHITNENSYVMLLAFALFAYSVAGFTHNASIVSGDTLFWLLASPFIYKDIQITRYKNVILNKNK